MNIAANLADRSFIHTITAMTPEPTPESTISIYTSQTETNSECRKITPKTQKPTPQKKMDPHNPKIMNLDFFTYITSLRYPASTFYGVVIETGALRQSTAGYEQYLAYKKTHSKRIDTSRVRMGRIQFGIKSTSSIGSVTIKTPIGKIKFHILETNTLFLLCIDNMDALGIYYNNIDNMLVTPEGTFPVIRCFGHSFMLWDKSLESFINGSLNQNPSSLTNTELQRLHHRFGHPATERLHWVLERARYNDVNKKSIEYITKYYLHCQKHRKSPGCFKFTLRTNDDPIFNYSIYVDIIYIDGSPILHVINEAIRFQAAKWLRDLSAKYTWETLQYCWMDTYLGPPDLITHDAEKNFVSKEFRQYAASLEIITKSIPVEAHWNSRKGQSKAKKSLQYYHGGIKRTRSHQTHTTIDGCQSN